MNSENYDYKKIELTIDKHELYQTFNVRISDLKFSKFVQKTIFYFLLVFSITYFTQVIQFKFYQNFWLFYYKGANYAILASVFLISCRLFYLNQQIVDGKLKKQQIKSKLLFVYNLESLLVIPSVGIQLTCHFMSGRKSFKTFEMKSIQDIVINESITMVG